MDSIKWFLVPIACILSAYFCIPQSFAADPQKRQAHTTDYLREMPSAERVMADFRGGGLVDTALDTAMRQIAALRRMITMITLQQEGGEFFGKPTAEEEALKSSYYDAINSIKSDPNFGEAKQKRLNIYDQDQNFEGDKKIEKELLERYFSPAWQAKYLGITMTLAQERAMIQAKDAREREVRKAKERAANPGVNLTIFLIGSIVMCVGLSGLMWVRKRVLKRTNAAGVEIFSSELNLASSNIVEFFVSFACLAMIIGVLLSIVILFTHGL